MASSSEKSLNFNVQCSDDLVATEIPLDLQIEIITRLPAKSLMRFKCVSRLWSSLIRSRYLRNRHLTVPSQPRLYMSLVEKHELGSMEVCNNPRESVLLSLSSSSSDTAKSFDQDLTMPGLGGDNMVALHGLILHNVCGKACIYNPTTRQSVTLPAVKSNIFPEEGFRNSVFYFFGHDPVLDKYKVVCTLVISSIAFKRITSEHWVFVLEVGGSWKRIEFVESHIPDRPRPGLCINGVIYYLASSCMSREIVVSFDVRSEELNMIRAPDLLVYSFGKYVGFIEYGGKPAIFDHTYLQETGLVELWVLEDGGIWSRKYLGLQPCQMHLVDNINLAVEGTTQNGEVILAPIPMPSPYYILYYDLQKNDLRKVNVRGISDHWFSKSYSYFVKLMDKSESIMHLET